MTYTTTTATDVKDLLGKIRDFAVTDGWTAAYDDVASNGRLGLSKGNCKVSFQSANLTRTDEVNGGTLNDSRIRMALCTAFAGGVTTYWGHTGSLCTGDGDVDTVETIDLYGPFANVWLFSNAAETHVHVVVQSASNRYSHLSFGIVDEHGLSQPDVAYVAGNNYVWWPDNSDFTSNNSCDFNWPGSSAHNIGYFMEGNQNVFIPDGLLDPSLGFADGDVMTRSIWGTHNRGWTASESWQNSSSRWADFFLGVNNDVTTGGVPLTTLPLIYSNGSNYVFLGSLPDLRLVNMGSLSPAQEIVYGSDTWMVFPMKQKGERAATNYGANPEPRCNSIEYGFAFKKVV